MHFLAIPWGSLSPSRVCQQYLLEGIVGAFYHGMYGEDPEVREASFLAIQDIGANGLNLPHPNQFGLG